MIKVKPKVTRKADIPLLRGPVITVTKDAPEVWIFGEKPRRGRPSTGKAMTNAQRQAKFKALKKAHGNG